MRTPGEKCSKKVRELLEKGNAPKLSKNHTVQKKSAETVQAANQGINSETLGYTESQRRFATACGRFNKFS
jgi:hypothetical protein